MQGGFRIQPGSAARSAEQEKKEKGPVPTFRIGSAAKSAEQRARESEAVSGSQFQPSAGVRISVATGQKFALPDRATGPGEALPVTPAAAAAVPPQPSAPQQPAPSATAPPSPQGLSRLLGKFRGLFGRNV